MQWMALVPVALIYVLRFLFSGGGMSVILLAGLGYFFMQNEDIRQQVMQFLASLLQK